MWITKASGVNIESIHLMSDNTSNFSKHIVKKLVVVDCTFVQSSDISHLISLDTSAFTSLQFLGIKMLFSSCSKVKINFASSLTSHSENYNYTKNTCMITKQKV